MTYTETTPEWRILDYLCPRAEVRYITPECLRAQLHDLTADKYSAAFEWLMTTKGFIGYKLEQPTMLTATSEGHTYRNILKGRIDKEKTEGKEVHWKDSHPVTWEIVKSTSSAIIGAGIALIAKSM